MKLEPIDSDHRHIITRTTTSATNITRKTEEQFTVLAC
jgi:hypothetical protein